MHRSASQRGFTLPELIITGCGLFVLVLVAILLIHPKDYALQRRDAQRWTDVALLAQALNHYVADHGMLPADLPARDTVIGAQDGEVDLCGDFMAYMKHDLPFDPLSGGKLAANCAATNAVYTTGYSIQRAGDDTVTISAPDAELGAISLTRKYSGIVRAGVGDE